MGIPISGMERILTSSHRPIEAAVALFPFYEFLVLNPVIPSVIIESLSTELPSGNRLPMIYSFISLASYLFTHASSLSSNRSLAYSNLAMRVCLAIAENETVVSKLGRETGNVRICRQVRLLHVT